MSSSTWRPSGRAKSIATLRLLEFHTTKYSALPVGPRPGSPPFGRSTFTTSAPSQASACVQDVPASYCVMSKMRMPFKAAPSWPLLTLATDRWRANTHKRSLRSAAICSGVVPGS